MGRNVKKDKRHINSKYLTEKQFWQIAQIAEKVQSPLPYEDSTFIMFVRLMQSYCVDMRNSWNKERDAEIKENFSKNVRDFFLKYYPENCRSIELLDSPQWGQLFNAAKCPRFIPGIGDPKAIDPILYVMSARIANDFLPPIIGKTPTSNDISYLEDKLQRIVAMMSTTF